MKSISNIEWSFSSLYFPCRDCDQISKDVLKSVSAVSLENQTNCSPWRGEPIRPLEPVQLLVLSSHEYGPCCGSLRCFTAFGTTLSSSFKTSFDSQALHPSLLSVTPSLLPFQVSFSSVLSISYISFNSSFHRYLFALCWDASLTTSFTSLLDFHLA